MRISIIIPVLNEIENITAALESTRSASTAQVIVVDGGSRDGSVDAAKRMGAEILLAKAGRACQMNAGACCATGDALLFLHADTRLPAGFDFHVGRILLKPGIVAGAFKLRIDSSRTSLGFIEWAANLRSLVRQMPYGDQGIFMRAESFRAAGGYPEIPIMEDFALMRRMRRMGRIAIAPASVVASARRWEKNGVLKTTLLNRLAIACYHIGISPNTIARWYRAKMQDKSLRAGSAR